MIRRALFSTRAASVASYALVVLAALALLAGTFALLLYPALARAGNSGAAVRGGDCQPGRNCKAKTFKATTASGTAVSIPQGTYLALDGTAANSTAVWAVFGDGVEIVFRTNSLNRSWVSSSGFVTTQSFTSSAGSGATGISLSTNGARLDLGTGANDYFTSDGTTISTPGSFVSTGSITASTVILTGGQVRDTGASARLNIPNLSTTTITGEAVDGATAVGIALDNSTALSTTGAKLVSFTNASSEKAYVDKDGNYCTSGGVCVGSTGVTVSGYYDQLADATAFASSTRGVGGTVKKLDRTVTVAGSGAGNTYSLEVYDVTRAQVLCTASSIACTTAAGTSTGVDCSGSYSSGDQLVIRVNSSSCATKPKFNASVRLQE